LLAQLHQLLLFHCLILVTAEVAPEMVVALVQIAVHLEAVQVNLLGNQEVVPEMELDRVDEQQESLLGDLQEVSNLVRNPPEEIQADFLLNLFLQG
jgi:hypothetical protein